MKIVKSELLQDEDNSYIYIFTSHDSYIYTMYIINIHLYAYIYIFFSWFLSNVVHQIQVNSILDSSSICFSFYGILISKAFPRKGFSSWSLDSSAKTDLGSVYWYGLASILSFFAKGKVKISSSKKITLLTAINYSFFSFHTILFSALYFFFFSLG